VSDFNKRSSSRTWYSTCWFGYSTRTS